MVRSLESSQCKEANETRRSNRCAYGSGGGASMQSLHHWHAARVRALPGEMAPIVQRIQLLSALIQ